MRVLCTSDIHGDPASLSCLPGLADDDLLVVAGDLTHFGRVADAAQVVAALRRYHPRLLLVAGNLDHPEVEDFLNVQGITVHGTGRIIDGVGFFGVGGSNPTPFHTPFELSENDIARLLEEAYAKVAHAPVTVLVSHPPPYNTRVDTLAGGGHAGSRTVRAFIEETQPTVCLCGHIHEAKGIDRIGETLVVNPGPLSLGYGLLDLSASSPEIELYPCEEHTP